VFFFFFLRKTGVGNLVRVKIYIIDHSEEKSASRLDNGGCWLPNRR